MAWRNWSAIRAIGMSAMSICSSRRRWRRRSSGPVKLSSSTTKPELAPAADVGSKAESRGRSEIISDPAKVIEEQLSKEETSQDSINMWRRQLLTKGRQERSGASGLAAPYPPRVELTAFHRWNTAPPTESTPTDRFPEV